MNPVSCNLCGGDEWRVRYPVTASSDRPLAVEAFRCTSAGYGSHLQIVECRRCGHVYANPCWDHDELLRAYGEVEDETYREQRAGRERTFARHLQALETVTGPAAGRQLLDIGAYIGVFVEVALRSGWDALGVEPSAWATAVAREQGLPVIQGTSAAAELAGRQFDVVTLWDVIEHLEDPAAELRRAYELLRPGGFLAVHTMDIDSPMARLLGRRWPWLMDMHLHYFSRRTLAEMIGRSGFEVMWVGPQGRYLSLGYLASRLEAMSRPLGRAAGWVIGGLNLGEAMVPVNFGDLITAYARRPKV